MGKRSLKGSGRGIPEKTYELLSLAKKGGDITVRDDQYDFSCLLDSAKLCRRRGFRFRLVDSGELDTFQLEWLGEAGADLYTSDEARLDFSELELANRACKRGGAYVAYFHHGPLKPDEKQSPVPFSWLQEIGKCGIYLHITNRERQRDIFQLNELAYACRKGGSWLVYYHHGPLEASFSELGRNGTWVHVSDQYLLRTDDTTPVLDQVKSLLTSRLNLVLHLEKGLDFSLLRKVMAAGAFVLFKSSLFEYKSPFRILEREARRKKLDFRAYYLYPAFLP